MRLIHFFLLPFFALTNYFASSQNSYSSDLSEYGTNHPQKKCRYSDREIFLQVNFSETEEMRKYLKDKYCFELFFDKQMIWSALCSEISLGQPLLKTTLNVQHLQQNFELGYQILSFETLRDVSKVDREQYAERDLDYDYRKHHLAKESFTIMTPNLIKSSHKKPENVVNISKAQQYSCFSNKTVNKYDIDLNTVLIDFSVEESRLSHTIWRDYE